jgi:uncharacterized protein YndB with AHSA1/START domain
MRRIKPEIEAFTGATWEFPTYEIVMERTRNYDLFRDLLSSAYGYMSHLRHHNYPSPLLDWTRSPYIAAYFAFAKETSKEHVAIYAFSEQPNKMKVTGRDTPSIYSLGPLVRTHERHFRQQSRYTVCAKFNSDLQWHFAPHQSVFELGEKEQDLLWKIVVPASERLKVLAKLDRFNLNAVSLFASEESLLETLAFRDIDLQSWREVVRRNSGVMTKSAQFGEGTVAITRVFDAPGALVWKAWTDPKMMAQWFGPRGFTASVPELDVRVGGTLRIVMHGPDGNDYPMKGVFREVVPPERLVFSNIAVDQDGNHLLEGETIVTFAEHGGKTTLTLKTHAVGRVPIAPQMLAGMEAGWSQSLDKLQALLARAG